MAQDWPNVLEAAERNAVAAGVSSRYQPLPGDAFSVDFGADYDAVLLTNLLHHFDRDSCVRLLKKIHSSLAVGGRLMTLESIVKNMRTCCARQASLLLR